MAHKNKIIKQVMLTMTFLMVMLIAPSMSQNPGLRKNPHTGLCLSFEDPSNKGLPAVGAKVTTEICNEKDKKQNQWMDLPVGGEPRLPKGSEYPYANFGICLTFRNTTTRDTPKLCYAHDPAFPVKNWIVDDPKDPKTLNKGKWRVYRPLELDDISKVDNYKVPAIPGYENAFKVMYVNDASGFRCLNARGVNQALMILSCDKNNPAQYWISS